MASDSPYIRGFRPTIDPPIVNPADAIEEARAACKRAYNAVTAAGSNLPTDLLHFLQRFGSPTGD